MKIEIQGLAIEKQCDNYLNGKRNASALRLKLKLETIKGANIAQALLTLLCVGLF